MVLGAGMGGLVAAATLAARGLAVEVVERAAVPGGKLRQLDVDGRAVDSGPTVFTMPDVLRTVFRDADDELDARVELRQAGILARHGWEPGERLDLHADRKRSAAAIGAFAGMEAARGFERFSAAAERIRNTLDEPFMRRPAPSLLELLGGAGPRALRNIDPFRSLWRALHQFFPDPRLQQLFGRYATYVGSSPFETPATLMLVAAVEADGVWLVEGGMIRLAEAVAALATRHGARFRFGETVRELVVERGRARGVLLGDGERIEADAVVCNADVSALGSGLLGERAARAARPVPRKRRSLSALTWSLVGRAEGFPLARHTVLFSADYPAEFAVLRTGRFPDRPTVYLCAQDRDDAGVRLDGRAEGDTERMLVIANAPARGDEAAGDGEWPGQEEIERCREAAWAAMRRGGLQLRTERALMTGPGSFARMFPGTGGALYGRNAHGWRASFVRPGVRSRVPGLFLAGGSVHPGPGLSMAALSGRMAAAAVLSELGSRASMAR